MSGLSRLRIQRQGCKASHEGCQLTGNRGNDEPADKGDLSERRSIGSLETLLSAEGFVRAHAGFIVNIDYILNIEKKDVKLTNGISIPLSRSRAKEVKIQFMRRSCLSGD